MEIVKANPVYAYN